MLLVHFRALLAQPMRQSIFIYLLDLTMSVISMDGKTGFANNVAKFVAGLEFHSGSFYSLWV